MRHFLLMIAVMVGQSVLAADKKNSTQSAIIEKAIRSELKKPIGEFTKADLDTFSCPDALPALILHSADDRLFPGFGAEIASWLAACNGCQEHPGEKDENECIAYSGCKAGGDTVYCEGTGSHIEWPALNTALLSFLADTGPQW